ncbi:hypothetical protein MPL3356_60570 [Mesorhizobium plurifarium]|uniref:Uncharacterized protein n=1 Tax=Mesorhizobium plurifarium TaxID=69974 RepID=A0A090EA81_MESPL|nr:hypothetical protein MPL3356_60570 [Mesorhizobium plurifarium]
MSDFKDWMARTGLTPKTVQEHFGVSHNVTWTLGKEDAELDLRTRLAMSAVAAGLQPWAPENAHEPEAVRPVLDAVRKALAPPE